MSRRKTAAGVLVTILVATVLTFGAVEGLVAEDTAKSQVLAGSANAEGLAQTRILEVYAWDGEGSFPAPVSEFTMGQDVYVVAHFLHPGGPAIDQYAVLRNGKIIPSTVCNFDHGSLEAGEWWTWCLAGKVPPLPGVLTLRAANRHFAADLPPGGVTTFSSLFEVGP